MVPGFEIKPDYATSYTNRAACRCHVILSVGLWGCKRCQDKLQIISWYDYFMRKILPVISPWLWPDWGCKVNVISSVVITCLVFNGDISLAAFGRFTFIFTPLKSSNKMMTITQSRHPRNTYRDMIKFITFECMAKNVGQNDISLLQNNFSFPVDQCIVYM